MAVESIIRKLGFEEVLDFRGACRPGHIEGGAVTIVDCINVVGRGDHVESWRARWWRATWHNTWSLADLPRRSTSRSGPHC